MSSRDMTGWKSRSEDCGSSGEGGARYAPEDTKVAGNKTLKQGSGHYNNISHNIDYATHGLRRAAGPANLRHAALIIADMWR